MFDGPKNHKDLFEIPKSKNIQADPRTLRVLKQTKKHEINPNNPLASIKNRSVNHGFDVKELDPDHKEDEKNSGTGDDGDQG